MTFNPATLRAITLRMRSLLLSMYVLPTRGRYEIAEHDDVTTPASRANLT